MAVSARSSLSARRLCAERRAAGRSPSPISQLTTATTWIRADLEVVERPIVTAQPVLGQARALIAAGDVPIQCAALDLTDRRAIIQLLADSEILTVSQGRKAIASVQRTPSD